MPYGFSGPAWDDEYFVQEMTKMLKRKKEQIFEELQEIKNRSKGIANQKRDILKKLKIDRKFLALIKLAKESIYAKAYSKDALFFGYYAAEPLLREIAKRLNIELRLLRHMLPWEIEPALIKDVSPSQQELENRWQYSFQYIKNGKNSILTGQDAHNFVAKLNLVREIETGKNVHEIRGSCAMGGNAKGLVKIINKPADMKKMKQGDILVSYMTDPEIIVAMKKAAAIITDAGGITCHAAIVARELGIPCVIGAKIATKVLKDGDIVEVDANNGLVKIIK